MLERTTTGVSSKSAFAVGSWCAGGSWSPVSFIVEPIEAANLAASAGVAIEADAGLSVPCLLCAGAAVVGRVWHDPSDLDISAIRGCCTWSNLGRDWKGLMWGQQGLRSARLRISFIDALQ